MIMDDETLKYFDRKFSCVHSEIKDIANDIKSITKDITNVKVEQAELSTKIESIENNGFARKEDSVPRKECIATRKVIKDKLDNHNRYIYYAIGFLAALTIFLKWITA